MLHPEVLLNVMPIVYYLIFCPNVLLALMIVLGESDRRPLRKLSTSSVPAPCFTPKTCREHKELELGEQHELQCNLHDLDSDHMASC